MIAPISAVTLVAVIRYYLRPLRRTLDRTVHPPAGRTWGVRLGPVVVAGHSVVLRSPRVSDADQWRAVRLREQERIEPWWASSPLCWEDRHTEARWVTSVLQARREGRAGLSLPLVVEVDGRLAGQCGLEWIAPHTGTAEMGIWMDSRWASTGISGIAAGMMVDHAMNRLGLHRLIAPISEGNLAAAWGAEHLGMRREGVMAGYLDVGGERRDHHLWAITADRVPPGGVTGAMLSAAAAPRATRRNLPPT
ncbi:GNAT family protein [Pseudonocardia sp.]|jgi:RimJ/RimL family protein N-acetyltransferase|uniref:GNAT family N-acetyltransferase n=1 Tax=Pseudonocardia sp. TaxID=60912 RepID=UPI00262EA612|nr:GNAT family protein [Pseudonocardia sp.]MCW2722411.1 putative acetyltransferase [Pseudonocardia sp.]